MSHYIIDLSQTGRYHFLKSEVSSEFEGTRKALNDQLLRLKRKRLIAEPIRGFFVIVPPEYQSMECLPALQFVHPLMAYMNCPYYVGLLTAAAHYGATHQAAQVTQVIVAKNRPLIECGRVRIQFIARSSLKDMPTNQVKTARGYVDYATAEVTALELVGYPNHCGGLSNVATVLYEMADEIDLGRLLEVAAKSPISWCQRLGYLYEFLGVDRFLSELSQFVQDRNPRYTLLRRAARVSGQRSETWRVIVNETLEPDL